MSGGVLVSTPSRRIRHDEYLMTSSPDLPSLDELLGRYKKPPLQSGSRAAPIPDNAARTFTTAAGLWRSQQTESVLDFPAEQPKVRTKPSTRETQAPKVVIELSSDPPASDLSPLRRGGNAATAAEGHATESDALKGSSPLKERPWKKFKSPQECGSGDGQTKLPRGKVTKPSSRPREDRKKPETVSSYFLASGGRLDSKASNALGKDEATLLEPTTRRRAAWTPPPQDSTTHILYDPAVLREAASSQDNTQSDGGAGKVFESLHATFECQKDEGDIEAKQPAQEGKKRKVVDLVAANGAHTAKTASQVKKKAPKKKQRTLTELATAAYAAPGGVPPVLAKGKLVTASLLEYFPSQGVVSCNPGHPSARLRKGTTLATDKPTRKKTGILRKNVLLSPTSAAGQSSRQDYVFGTSSQLAGDKPATSLWESQMAMHASSQPEEHHPLARPVGNGSVARRSIESGQLWSVAARGEDGHLANIEIVDLVDSPAYPVDPLAGVVAGPGTDTAMAVEPKKTSLVDADPSDVDMLPLPRPRPHASTQISDPFSAPKSKPTALGQGRAANVAAPAAAARPSKAPDMSYEDRAPLPSNQDASHLQRERKGIPEATGGAPRPTYEVFTDAQLAKEVSSYGFKAIKKRTAMIALLDECWASKNRTLVTGNLQQSCAVSSTASAAQPRSKSADAGASKVTTSSSAPTRGRPRKESKPAAVLPPEPEATAKRPRGRPRKESSTASNAKTRAPTPLPPVAQSQAPTAAKGKKPAAREAIVDIEDSDLEDSTSADDCVFSPAAVDLSVGEDTELSLAMSPTDQQSALFGYIMKAVTGTPPSKDPLKPSWHEKMLMYDPIVLEDLAAWLNSGQLDRAGYDGEVSALDLKKWCESRSICCIWRVTLQGGERKRL